MTARQELESHIISKALEPSEHEGGVSCIAAEELIWAFRGYLQDKDISAGVFNNVADYGRYRDSEVVFHLSIEEAQTEVASFADHLATRPEVNIADYWGGTLPPLLDKIGLDSGRR